MCDLRFNGAIERQAESVGLGIKARVNVRDLPVLDSQVHILGHYTIHFKHYLGATAHEFRNVLIIKVLVRSRSQE